MRMICNKYEVADRLVMWEGFRIQTILLSGILESWYHKGEVPSYKAFHEFSGACIIRFRSTQVILQVVFYEGSKVGTGNEVHVQHHYKVGSRIQPSQISPSIELPRPLRQLEWGENEVDVDIG